MSITIVRAGTNAWFNMPHLATDDYLFQFANLPKKLLRPDVNIYVEYSNEAWGTLFAGGIYSQQKGDVLRVCMCVCVCVCMCAYLCVQGCKKKEIVWL